jgi:hypothetical protein
VKPPFVLDATYHKTTKKPRHPFPGNPAISMRPVAFRPRLTAGLAFSGKKKALSYASAEWGHEAYLNVSRIFCARSRTIPLVHHGHVEENCVRREGKPQRWGCDGHCGAKLAPRCTLILASRRSAASRPGTARSPAVTAGAEKQRARSTG